MVEKVWIPIGYLSLIIILHFEPPAKIAINFHYYKSFRKNHIPGFRAHAVVLPWEFFRGRVGISCVGIG